MVLNFQNNGGGGGGSGGGCLLAKLRKGRYRFILNFHGVFSPQIPQITIVILIVSILSIWSVLVRQKSFLQFVCSISIEKVIQITLLVYPLFLKIYSTTVTFDSV